MQKYILLVIINLAVNSFAQELQIEGTITHNTNTIIIQIALLYVGGERNSDCD